MPNLQSLAVSIFIAPFVLAGCTWQSSPPPAVPPPADDAVVWVEEGIEHEGAVIALGFRDEPGTEGRWIEPVVKITQNGRPLANAMIFSGLVSDAGGETSAGDVATVYEADLYAQGKLPVPAGAKKCVVRLRILLPDSDAQWTRDFVIELP